MASSANQIIGPHVPYVAVIPGGLQPGKAILLKGLVLAAKESRFEVNIGCGLLVDGMHMDDVALHFNCRFEETQLVLNTLVNNKWGVEERYPNDVFRKGQSFEIRILAVTDFFKIAVNGKHLCNYQHRIDLLKTHSLYVKGCVQLDFIEYQTNDAAIRPVMTSGAASVPPPPYSEVPTTPPYPTHININMHMPSAPPYPQSGNALQMNNAYSDNAAKSMPIYNPPVPYMHATPGGLNSRNRLYLTLTPHRNATYFCVNFHQGQDTLFHTSVRFNEQAIVRNSKRSNVWQREERAIQYFPCKQGDTYVFVYTSTQEAFKVAINGEHFFSFNHRSSPSFIDQISIEGNVAIQQFHLQ